MANDGRYYPNRSDYPSHQTWQDQVNLYKGMYEAQDNHAALVEHVKGLSKPTQQEFPNGASNTKIAGLNVSGSPTANGQKLVWNSTTGQLEWQ